MRLINLIAFSLILIIIYINYADAISCYVCNSLNDNDCDNISTNKNKSNYYKDCDKVKDERLEYYNYNVSSKQLNTDDNNAIDCAFCKQIETRGFSKCRTIKFEIKDYIGEDEDRTIRDCAGVFEIDNGCHHTRRNHYQFVDCVCDKDGCNDNVNRIYNNIYVTIFFLIVSFLFN